MNEISPAAQPPHRQELRARAAASTAWAVLLAWGVAAVLPGCGPVEWVGVRLFYRRTDLPGSQVIRDLVYAEGPTADSVKNRLDLFLPMGSGWPTVVFVHGGWWRAGDRGLRAGGEDVYGNIGRFLAARGFGAAVISHRLQPGVDWRDQVDDVARAAAWVHAHVGEYGGDPASIVLCGHSAGAHLAARLAVDAHRMEKVGLPASCLRGVVLVSGSGFDFSDEETYRLGASRALVDELFGRGDAAGDWEREASVIPHVTAALPPFLILHAEGEPAYFHRQARLLHRAFGAMGVRSRLVPVPGGSHARMVLALSRADQAVGAAVLSFLEEVGHEDHGREGGAVDGPLHERPVSE
ncbi:MAG: alpha/beta hydrolase [Planctomycetes bacterium]|nr:alpha/beta hydrolase [Planctomycetota bacterium]